MTTSNDPGRVRPGVNPGVHVDEALAWHQLTPDKVATHLTVDSDAGLTSQEVATRLESFGPNRLLETPVVRKNAIGTMVLPITRCYTPY